MRKKQIFNKTIMFALMLSIVLAPLSFAQKAKAQSASAYLKGVLPAVAQLPLCNVQGAVMNLFKSKTGKLTEELDVEQAKKQASWQAEIEAENAAETGVSAMTAVPTFDEYLNKKVDENLKLTGDNNKKLTSLEQNDTCLKSIGRLLIKMLLQKMTLSTVDWINNGFNGSPAFLEKPGEFFEDIAKNEILQFGAEIDNPELFPFGRAFMENQAVAFKNKFADNARYSLNELITDTNPSFSAATFSEDFSQGGWDAWTYMTQIPANNPLGFQIMASNELQKRLAGTEQSDAQNLRDSLTQAGGFLGDMRCSSNDTITKEEHDAWLRGDKVVGRECKGGFKYVTPGGMVAQAATNLVNYPENNLLKADDLNDAIAAILDALLNKWSSDLMNNGFSALEFANGAESGNLILENNFGNYGINQTSLDYTDFVIEASSWLKQNPDFNIRTDLNQALIDEQRTYIDKVKVLNEELNQLIMVTRQLDYCIPGPHPGWENDSWEILNEKLDKTPSFEESIDGDGFWAIAAKGSEVAGSIAPGSGLFNTLYTLWEEEVDKPKYYAEVIKDFTSINVEPNGKTTTMQQARNVIEIIFDRYQKIIDDVFTKNPSMPLVTEEAANEFLKIAGYEKMIENNTKKTNNLKSVTSRLISLKSEIEKLNYNLQNNTLTEEEYEESIEPLLNSFGRLSAEMVSGDNIANIDKIMKQTVDKKNYIYKDLLKGPNGCEWDISQGESVHLPWQFFEEKRPPYPYKILYDYNELKSEDIIPDPWNSGYVNKMIKGKVNTSDQGFLKHTIFEFDTTGVTASWQLHPDQFSYPVNHPWALTLSVDPDDMNTELIINKNKGSWNLSHFEHIMRIY